MGARTMTMERANRIAQLRIKELEECLAHAWEVAREEGRELSAEREARERLREAAEAVLWASNVERIYAAEGEELVAMVKERREAFAALSVALEEV